MAINSKYKIEEYRYGVHVERRRQLYMMSDKKIYCGEWLIAKTDPIIIIEMSKKIADHEAPFYLEVNGHDNIIRTFGCVGNTDNLTIFIQEFAENHDLANVLMDNQFTMTQSILKEMFTQVASAMSYVASKKIVHGDLGCRNVLVFRLDPNEPRNNLVKITDFGLSRWINRAPADESSMVTPIRYCATEILRNNRHSSYSEKSDVYSMGVLVWEALSNSEIPYSSVAEDDDVKQKKLNNESLPRPPICDRQLWVLMNNCWNKDPKERPSFEEIKNKLMHMKISEVPHPITTTSSPKHYDYELDIHVTIKDTLNHSYPLIHEAGWKSENKGPIVIIEKNEEPSEYERSFYTKFKDHRHIVHTYGFVENDRRSTMILQERAPHGNLKVLLESRQFQPSAKVLVAIFLQITSTMIDIAGQGLVHGDLRCENILVFKMHPSDPNRNLVKLANFTLAHKNDPSLSDDRRLLVPARYCALEILRSAGRSNYSEYSDVYAMGILMWQAYSKGKLPYYSSKTNSEVRQRKLKGEKLLRPYLCDERIWNIMKECLLNEPQVRLEFKVIKSLLDTIKDGPIEPYKYELDVDIRQKRPLDGMDGKYYAVDWIRKKKSSPVMLYVMDEATAERAALFYMILKAHSHIVLTFGLVKNDVGSVMLLQERPSHGNLQTLLQGDEFRPSPQVLVTIFRQIVNGMIYITEQGIVHGDLRCANIFVFEMDSTEPTRNLVKLTSFSLARRKDQLMTDDRLFNTPVQYCALEILRNDDGSSYSELSDVYSMGVLMWEACSKGEVPYGRRKNDHDVRQQRLNGNQLTKPKDCPNQLWTAIEHCWLSELSIRFTFKELETTLSTIDIPPIRRIHCNRCNNDIPENEMNNHQKTCLPPRSPLHDNNTRITSPRVDHDNPTYLHDDNENTQTSRPVKRPRVEPPISVHYPLCKYCGDAYPDGLIEDHQNLCHREPRLPTVVIPPAPSYTKCNRCNKQLLRNQLADHHRKCQPTPFTSIDGSISQHPIRNEPYVRRPPSTRTPIYQDTSAPESRSLWDYIRSCLCFSSSKK